jgi:hypothetical protein
MTTPGDGSTRAAYEINWTGRGIERDFQSLRRIGSVYSSNQPFGFVRSELEPGCQRRTGTMDKRRRNRRVRKDHSSSIERKQDPVRMGNQMSGLRRQTLKDTVGEIEFSPHPPAPSPSWRRGGNTTVKGFRAIDQHYPKVSGCQKAMSTKGTGRSANADSIYETLAVGSDPPRCPQIRIVSQFRRAA